jgi:hypothetical protein
MWSRFHQLALTYPEIVEADKSFAVVQFLRFWNSSFCQFFCRGEPSGWEFDIYQRDPRPDNKSVVLKEGRSLKKFSLSSLVRCGVFRTGPMWKFLPLHHEILEDENKSYVMGGHKLSQQGEGIKCSLCMQQPAVEDEDDDSVSGLEARVPNMIQIVACGHLFHRSCFVAGVKSNQNKCPNCRDDDVNPQPTFSLFEDDDEQELADLPRYTWDEYFHDVGVPDGELDSGGEENIYSFRDDYVGKVETKDENEDQLGESKEDDTSLYKDFIASHVVRSVGEKLFLADLLQAFRNFVKNKGLPFNFSKDLSKLRREMESQFGDGTVENLRPVWSGICLADEDTVLKHLFALMARVRPRFFALFEKTEEELDELIAGATDETPAGWLEAVTTLRGWCRNGREITEDVRTSLWNWYSVVHLSRDFDDKDEDKDESAGGAGAGAGAGAGY